MVPLEPPAKFVAVAAVPLAVVKTVPLVAGKVRIVEPATAGACKVTDPDVSPDITNELMFFP
jgi:hypothetical protein